LRDPWSLGGEKRIKGIFWCIMCQQLYSRFANRQRYAIFENNKLDRNYNAPCPATKEKLGKQRRDRDKNDNDRFQTYTAKSRRSSSKSFRMYCAHLMIFILFRSMPESSANPSIPEVPMLTKRCLRCKKKILVPVLCIRTVEATGK